MPVVGAWAALALLMLLCWISTSAHAAVAVVDDTDFIQVAAGYKHTVAVKADGTVWSWGRDNFGQLGDDAPLADKSTPVQVAGLSGVRQVAAGGFHSIAVKADGTVWTWGADFSGQLGDDGAFVDKPTPVQVAGLTGVRQVAGGDSHSIAVKADGTVWTWGDDSFGQLGDDVTLLNKSTPVQVAGLTGIRQVAASGEGYYSIAVKVDGTVWTWGDDQLGQLGDDAALSDKPTPVQVAGLTGTGFGITVSSATNLEAGWSAGTRYAALSATPTSIHSTGAAFTANTANATNTVVGYKVTVPAAQPPGAYTATVTYTAIAIP